MKAKKTTRKVKAPAKRSSKAKARTPRRRYRTPAEWIGPGSEDAPTHVKAIIIEEKDNQARVDDAARKAQHYLDQLSILMVERGPEGEEAVLHLWSIMEEIEEWIYNMALAPAESADGHDLQQARLTAGAVLGITYNRLKHDFEAAEKSPKKSNISRTQKLMCGVEGCEPNEGFVTNFKASNRGRMQSPFALWCYRLLKDYAEAGRRGEMWHRVKGGTTYNPSPDLFGADAKESLTWRECVVVLQERFNEVWLEMPTWALTWKREQPKGSPPPTWKNYRHTARAVFEILWLETGHKLEREDSPQPPENVER
jgi:hypothetical protein